MAKRQREPQAKGGSLSATVRRAIDGLRRPFMGFVTQFSAVTARRAEIAPELMRVFARWQTETGNGSFIAFVRVLDPSVPMERDGYRVHRSYMAADYLRRLSGRGDTGANRAKPMRSSLQSLARMIATVTPLVADQTQLWQAISSEFGLKPRQVVRLREVVASVEPLFRIEHPRPVRRLNVIHMEPTTTAAAPAGGRQAAAA